MEGLPPPQVVEPQIGLSDSLAAGLATGGGAKPGHRATERRLEEAAFARLICRRCVALEDLGRIDDALKAYRDALALDPQNADAHYNLAGIYERRGEKQAALRHLKVYRSLIA